MWAPLPCSRAGGGALRSMTWKQPLHRQVRTVSLVQPSRQSLAASKRPGIVQRQRRTQASAAVATSSSDQDRVRAPITHRDPAPLDVHPVWLRDICPCEDCVDTSSGQKKFWTVDIPRDIRVKSCSLADDGALEYTWDNDLPGTPPGHVTRLRPEQIHEALGGPKSLSSNGKQTWFVDALRPRLCEVDHTDYISDPAAFREALVALHRDGLLFVRNVPESEQSVIDIAQRIGPLKSTFYGMTWDVKSVPKAKNVAYTSGHLGFHQDLLYMHDPPRLQFLHCLRSSAKGGASLFSDGYQACLDLHAADQSAFRDLCELPTTFHYHKDGKRYTQSRPTIEYAPRAGAAAPTTSADVLAAIRSINWSPPFQGPFTHLPSTTHIDRWHRAARAFRNCTEAGANVLERMMGPGDCVIFDNKRVLHARTAFAPGDAGKERWLKGCYVDADPYWSALRCNV